MNNNKLLRVFIGLNTGVQVILTGILYFGFQSVIDFMKVSECDGEKLFSTYFKSSILIIMPLGFVVLKWLKENRPEGLTLARYTGWTMLIASLNIGFALGRWDLAAMDLVRAVPIVIFAYMAKK